MYFCVMTPSNGARISVSSSDVLQRGLRLLQLHRQRLLIGPRSVRLQRAGLCLVDCRLRLRVGGLRRLVLRVVLVERLARDGALREEFRIAVVVGL